VTETTLDVEPKEHEEPTSSGEPSSDGAQEAEVLHCANHPNVETLLRCNRCGKPICLNCAELTDVGYRCKECIRGVQDIYFNAVPTDNIVAFVVALLVTAVAAPIAGLVFGLIRFGFFSLILAVIIGGTAGGILAQIIRSAIGRRRGRYLRYYALAGIVVGVLLGSILGLLILGIPTLTLPLIVFAFLAAMAAYQILR
jgi:hypothetical protein